MRPEQQVALGTRLDRITCRQLQRLGGELWASPAPPFDGNMC